MRKEEIELTKVFIKHIKTVGGRGPRNIYCKLEDDKCCLTFVFWLGKSALEHYVYEHTKNGTVLLKTLYHEIFDSVKVDLQKELSMTICETQPLNSLTLRSFEFDLTEDRFQVIFEYQ